MVACAAISIVERSRSLTSIPGFRNAGVQPTRLDAAFGLCFGVFFLVTGGRGHLARPVPPPKSEQKSAGAPLT